MCISGWPCLVPAVGRWERAQNEHWQSPHGLVTPSRDLSPPAATEHGLWCHINISHNKKQEEVPASAFSKPTIPFGHQ